MATQPGSGIHHCAVVGLWLAIGDRLVQRVATVAANGRCHCGCTAADVDIDTALLCLLWPAHPGTFDLPVGSRLHLAALVGCGLGGAGSCGCIGRSRALAKAPQNAHGAGHFSSGVMHRHGHADAQRRHRVRAGCASHQHARRASAGRAVQPVCRLVWLEYGRTARPRAGGKTH